MGEGGGSSSKLRRAAMKIFRSTCASFPRRRPPLDSSPPTITSNSPSDSYKPRLSCGSDEFSAEIAAETASPTTTTTTTTDKATSTKTLCAICLDPLSYGTVSNPGQAIFTAQCSHSFHFACISSNVRHGSVTCPICRAHWTQLPHNLNPASYLSCNQSDPVLRILDDSIASFRVHRRSFLRSAHYDDDDPIEPDQTTNDSRLHLSLIPIPLAHSSFHPYSLQSLQVSSRHHLSGSSTLLAAPPVTPARHFGSTVQSPYTCVVSNNFGAYLSVTLANPQATDLILVASPNGPHLRLLKQSMALVVFSLRPVDRLAIVTYSSAATRVFPLKRMTADGKRTALQVIDRLSCMGQADPTEGLKKGVKILRDRVHKNPRSCILHLSDSPTSHRRVNMEIPSHIPIHRFHVGFGFGTSYGFVMHEFENFLARVLVGVIREIQLRIGEDARVVRLGDLRGGDERRIALNLGGHAHVRIEYSYIEGGVADECIRTGEMMVGVGDDDGERTEGSEAAGTVAGRSSSVDSWDYYDPYMARRWAKHLHGYRL